MDGTQGFEVGLDQSDQFFDQFKGRSANGGQSRLNHRNSLDSINPENMKKKSLVKNQDFGLKQMTDI